MPLCPICNTEKTSASFVIEFYTTKGMLNTDVCHCKKCKIYWRVLTDDLLLDSHFEMSSYTNLQNENDSKMQRSAFFKQIIDLAKSQVKTRGSKSKTLLDFGCSYGHLMDIAKTDGFSCIGVELVDYLREKLGFLYEVHKDTDDITDSSVDIITCIDSLYYCNDILQQLQQFGRILKDDGLLIVRICNRNYFIRILRLLGRDITPRQFGDQLISLSHKSMKIISQAAGFEIKKVVYKENKPNKNKKSFVKLGYTILPVVCKLTGLKLTPGLIYVLQKKT